MLSVYGDVERFKICRPIILKEVLAMFCILLNSVCDVNLGGLMLENRTYMIITFKFNKQDVCCQRPTHSRKSYQLIMCI